ncbi:MAG: phosphomannomutase, partial [Gluconobacter cerinus]
LNIYIDRYCNFFGAHALSGLTLGVYQHSAVGRDVMVTIIEALGGKAVPLARSDVFVSVDTEAVREEDIVLAHEWAKTGSYDAILTTDGDSDRPLLADQQGNWIRGDILGILAAKKLGAAVVTTPVSSNTALETSGYFPAVRRTQIGSPFVVSAMTAAAAEGFLPSVGYEANGGFLLASDIVQDGKTLQSLPTRDAVLPMLCALIAAKDRKSNLKELLTILPPRFTVSNRLKNIPTERSMQRIQSFRENISGVADALGFVCCCGSVVTVDEIDGLRLTFQNGEIIHLRPSGNAPELRLYVEAGNQVRAEELLDFCLKSVEKWIK